MSWKCRDITLLCSSLSKPFFMSRHYSFGAVTLSFDVLKDVTAYVMAMSQHCSSTLPLSTDVAAMSRHESDGLKLSTRCRDIVFLVLQH